MNDQPRTKTTYKVHYLDTNEIATGLDFDLSLSMFMYARSQGRRCTVAPELTDLIVE